MFAVRYVGQTIHSLPPNTQKFLLSGYFDDLSEDGISINYTYLELFFCNLRCQVPFDSVVISSHN